MFSNSKKIFAESRFSARTAAELVDCFARDLTASRTQEKIHLSRKTVNHYFLNIRKRISRAVSEQNLFYLDEIDFDQSRLLTRLETKDRKEEIKPGYPVLVIIFPDGRLIAEIICSDSSEIKKNIGQRLFDLYRQNAVAAYGFTNLTCSSDDDSPIPYTQVPKITSAGSESLYPLKVNYLDFVHFSSNRAEKFFGNAPQDKYSYLRLRENQWRYNNLVGEEVLYACFSNPKLRSHLPIPKNLFNNLSLELFNLLKKYSG